MRPNLTRVLDLPSFRAAEVRIVVGDPAEHDIRWVHSSEVYEMGGLLAGGELLLTTGLGFYNRTAAQLHDYVEWLADAGCVALALETGRSLYEIPPVMIEAARERGMVLIELCAVVPFEQMIEDFHELLVRERMGTVRAAEPVWQELMGTVLQERGLNALLDVTARLGGCPASFLDTDDVIVGRSRIATAPEPGGPIEFEVRGPHASLGKLVLDGPLTRHRDTVGQRAAIALAIEVGRDSAGSPTPRGVDSLLRDLGAGGLQSSEELRERLATIGIHLRAGQRLFLAAAQMNEHAPAPTLLASVQKAAREVIPGAQVGRIGRDAVIIAPHPTGLTRVVAHQIRAAWATQVSASNRSALQSWVAASPVLDLSTAPTELADVQSALRLLHRVGLRGQVLLVRDVGLLRLLGDSVDPAATNAFVREQIGPIIDHDVAHGTALLQTLAHYLTEEGNKAKTAERLGIRRQNLYTRLTRIEGLLDVQLSQPAHRLALGAALAGWQLRTGLDPGAELGSA